MLQSPSSQSVSHHWHIILLYHLYVTPYWASLHAHLSCWHCLRVRALLPLCSWNLPVSTCHSHPLWFFVPLFLTHLTKGTSYEGWPPHGPSSHPLPFQHDNLLFFSQDSSVCSVWTNSSNQTTEPFRHLLISLGGMQFGSKWTSTCSPFLTR